MLLRQTKPEEYFSTEELTREAFWNVYKPGCDEHFILHNFRGSPDFVPELDFVAYDDGKLVAHIMYCRAYLRRQDGGLTEALMFGPVSVLPGRQRRGYGSAIIRHTLKKAASLGYGAVVITGNPAYYRRFGFESCSKRGIYYEGLPREEEAAFFMVKELREGYLPACECTFREPDGYSCDAQALDEYDRQFPPKVKEKRPGQLS